MVSPQLIFGTANVGSVWTNSEDIKTLAQLLCDSGIQCLDTAARYPPSAPGASQRTLGAYSLGTQGFAIDTKILAFSPDGSGKMTPEAIQKSVNESLEALQIEKINVLYSHRPNPSTPLAIQAKTLDTEFKLRHFKELGISNWPQALMQYQYNLLARSAEKEFIPFLRRAGIRLVAFSPLAGGFLMEQGARFKEGNPAAAGYRRWYIQPGMVAAVEKLTKLCTEYSLPLSEAALHWLAYHSALGRRTQFSLARAKWRR
ncbi:NADP-dependent oxidoreductase domain-containing protein [Mycena capillaripes]|nr:NADP-dependent oxidoreductase domain-containing protein [Mycena capillaripes]